MDKLCSARMLTKVACTPVLVTSCRVYLALDCIYEKLQVESLFLFIKIE